MNRFFRTLPAFGVVGLAVLLGGCAAAPYYGDPGDIVIIVPPPPRPLPPLPPIVIAEQPPCDPAPPRRTPLPRIPSPGSDTIRQPGTERTGSREVVIDRKTGDRTQQRNR